MMYLRINGNKKLNEAEGDATQAEPIVLGYFVKKQSESYNSTTFGVYRIFSSSVNGNKEEELISPEFDSKEKLDLWLEENHYEVSYALDYTKDTNPEKIDYKELTESTSRRTTLLLRTIR